MKVCSRNHVYDNHEHPQCPECYFIYRNYPEVRARLKAYQKAYNQKKRLNKVQSV